MGLLDMVRGMRPERPAARRRTSVPDPSVPPGNRGDWEEAALTNVEITELVKRQLRTNTSPQQK